ncbi:hypothetical protein [Amycolatopsis sp. YIM 10]|uniref:hypothetical protein n=1 Tax=Amycolatopsis sp. YIM 10 TaxID=2653857 RepID=UPI0012908775|nr:hypothetical protein [Amycolatopsis sp. YIM 10]QFU90936.1 hypothetical protein YIM_28820 [Amycolatopsis sp. YIM 10]
MTSTITPPTDVVGEETQMLRPVRTLPDVADPDVVRAVRRDAQKHLGMSELGAKAMSTMWANPGEVLPQISSPHRMRITGGDLLYIQAPAWTARLVPDPANPRIASSYAYQLAFREDADQAIRFERITPAQPMTPAELQTSAASQKDLVKQLNDSIAKTCKANEPYPPIAEQGIMDAPFGVMTQFNFSDGGNPIAVPVVREGSTRVSYGLEYLGLTAEDVLFRMPASTRPLRSLISDVNGVVQSPAETVRLEDLAKARVATVQFILIVGFHPDQGDTPDLAAAVKAKVAQEHINTKNNWKPSDRDATMADDCLASALNAGVVSADEHRWLSGDMSRDTAAKLGFGTYTEDRFLELVYLFATPEPKVHRAIRQPIAFVLARDNVRSGVQVRRTSKLPLAVELTVRELRFGDSGAAIDRIAKVLAGGANIAGKHVARPTSRTVEQLEEQAQAELDERKDTTPGPAGIELALRALYHGAYHGAFHIPRNDLGARSDRRPVHHVLQDMLGTPSGILQLGRIVENGRAGTPPVTIDEHGITVLAADGNPAPLTNEVIRYQLYPRGAATNEKTSDPVAAARKVMLEHMRDTCNAFSDFKMADGGRGGAEGLSADVAEQLIRQLTSMKEDADTWFRNGLKHAAMAELAAMSKPEHHADEESDEADVAAFPETQDGAS